MTIIPPIRLQNPLPVACRPYDPRSPDVARILSHLIRRVLPRVEVEHVGSTSVPYCAGKGYIDLMVLYCEGSLEAAKAGLATLGFQPQTSRDPFPEERPMRVGSFNYRDKEYQIHAHVIAMGSAEVHELCEFRDLLKKDDELREKYVEEKQRIIAAGVIDSIDYAEKKGIFVQRILAQRKSQAK